MAIDRHPGAQDLSSAGHRPGETTGTDERAPQQMATTVFTFDLVGELARLHAEQAWQRGDRNAKTLVKDADLRVVLIALRAGMRMEEHHAPGRITIQTIVGRLALRVAGQTVDLPMGHLLTLGPAIPHDVEAREESAFLLTIAWPS